MTRWWSVAYAIGPIIFRQFDCCTEQQARDWRRYASLGDKTALEESVLALIALTTGLHRPTLEAAAEELEDDGQHIAAAAVRALGDGSAG